ncbi:type II secretion system F family protein [Paenibacillus sp. NPDC058071]|uniref:type II secretion system F family protein n=1 Tax=Paenibacillus sp. NPDC058071 TaxID=3346326 RepID=UPI0036DF7D26
MKNGQAASGRKPGVSLAGKKLKPQSSRLRKLLVWSGWPSNGGETTTTIQFAFAAAVGYTIMFVALYIVYRSVPVSITLGVVGLCAPRFYRASLINSRKQRLKLQFKEALYSLASSLAAGRSVENAFVASIDDLRLLYPDPRTELLNEFQMIKYRLDNAEPLEQALRHLANRAGIDDITQFADVMAACKRSGGDLVSVMKRTSQTIGEKLEVQQEIAVMIAQKKFEARIMMAVPFAFLAFLGFAAPDYMAPLYGKAGYTLLTVGLAALAVCFWFIQRIMAIRI